MDILRVPLSLEECLDGLEAMRGYLYLVILNDFINFYNFDHINLNIKHYRKQENYK